MEATMTLFRKEKEREVKEAKKQLKEKRKK